MKFLIAFAVLIACVVALPADRDAQVLAQSDDINPDGSFANKLTVDNGISQEQAGQLKQVPGAEQPSISITGSFVQIGEDGQPQTITYTADEEGYKPSGPQIPQSQA